MSDCGIMLIITLWSIILFGFTFWYGYKKNHGAIAYCILFILRIILLKLDYDFLCGSGDGASRGDAAGAGMGRGFGLIFLYFLEGGLAIITIITIIINSIIATRRQKRRVNEK